MLDILKALLLASAFSLLLTGACGGPNRKQADSATPLTAAINGNIAQLKALDAAGFDLNAQYPSRYNWTALIAAIYFERPAVINYLLSRNVDVSKRDGTGHTALMWAIQMEDTNTVSLLVKKAPKALREGEDWPKVAAEIQADPNPERWRALLDQFFAHGSAL